MKRPLLYTLKSKLILTGLLILGLPMSVGTFYSIESFDKHIRGEAENELSSHLTTALLIYENQKQSLTSITQTISFDNTCKVLLNLRIIPQLSKYISSLAKNYDLNMLFIIDKDGKVLSQEYKGGLSVSDLSDHPLIKRALNGELLTSTEIESDPRLDVSVPGSVDSALMIEAAAPIYFRDKLVGAVLAGYLLNKNMQLVERIKQNNRGTESIIMMGNKVISSTFWSNDSTYLKEETPCLRRDLELGPGMKERKIEGDRYLFAFRQIKDINNKVIGSLGVAFNLQRMDAMKKATIGRMLFIAAAGILFSIILTLLISRKIADPIKAVVNGMTAAGKGSLDHRVAVTQKDEVGMLIQGFNSMADRLVKREQELEDEKNHALESSRLKSEFLANMSHEIRTPMNAVLGFADTLLDTDMNEDQVDYASTIKRSGESLLSLLNDILDFSKIEAGELDFEEIDFDLELLAYDVCELIRPRIESKPIEILCRIGDRLPPMVKGDPARFRQVLINLMGNACKFAESGEIELFIDIEDEKDDRIKTHTLIRDTGIGIPREKLTAIFMPFRQADGSTTRKYGGTGLGLSICKKISDLMGGDVWAESGTQGNGSIFHFTAWFVKAEEKRVIGFSPVSLSDKKILIVDDNQTNMDILTHLLDRAGMHVVALTKTREVIPALQKAIETGKPFDVCISDIRMPVMSGYDVARQIRGSKHRFSNIPLIALSSQIKRSASQCEEAGFDGFLSKPIRRKKLFRMLERVIGKKGGKNKDEEIKDKTKKQKILTQYSVREAIKHSVHILLVEDNPVNRKLAEVILKKAGYEISVAGNGREAVEKYTQSPERFALIFMDIQMPEMDGLEATRQIRRFETLNNKPDDQQEASSIQRVPVVAMTAHAMRGDREVCLEAGMDDYITKPIKRELVLKMIEKWVIDRMEGENYGNRKTG
jgi:signal transduction histidine kinase/CheY-like chemotaxis protein